MRLFIAFLPFALSICTAAVDGTNGGLRREDSQTQGERRTEWVMNQERIENYAWNVYDDDSVVPPESKWSTSGDSADYFLPSDVCKEGNSYSSSYCPSPPVCKVAETELPWPEKLCLNRVPKLGQSGQGTEFYIAVMKCIPIWENCDKCICGVMDSHTNLCQWVQTPYQDQDDDLFLYKCENTSKEIQVKHIAFTQRGNPSYLGKNPWIKNGSNVASGQTSATVPSNTKHHHRNRGTTPPTKHHYRTRGTAPKPRNHHHYWRNQHHNWKPNPPQP